MKIYESTLAGAAVRYPEIGQGRLSVALSEDFAEDSPVVLALHGSGRGIFEGIKLHLIRKINMNDEVQFYG